MHMRYLIHFADCFVVRPRIHPCADPALQPLNAVIFKNFACGREKRRQPVFEYMWWPYSNSYLCFFSFYLILDGGFVLPWLNLISTDHYVVGPEYFCILLCGRGQSMEHWIDVNRKHYTFHTFATLPGPHPQTKSCMYYSMAPSVWL